MRFPTLAVLAALTIPSVHAAMAEESVTWKDDVRGWYLGVDTSIGNGCFMTASYDDGTFLRMQFNPELAQFQFIIGSEHWESIEAGKHYNLSVAFGSRSPWTGEADGMRLGSLPALLLSVPFEDDKAETFIGELQQMPHVVVGYNGNEIASLELSGTYAAMEEVMQCQQAISEAADQQPAKAADPFSPAAPADPFR